MSLLPYRDGRIPEETPAGTSLSRGKRRRSGILNPAPQSLQRYFRALVRSTSSRSVPFTYLIRRFSDPHRGQQLREKDLISRAG